MSQVSLTSTIIQIYFWFLKHFPKPKKYQFCCLRHRKLMQNDVRLFSHQHPALYGKRGDEMFGLLEPGFTVSHSQHLILCCETILQCDTNTEFCNVCGYLFNKTQNFSAGRALFWTFLFFHLPTLKHKQVSRAWPEHACALNKHQFSFFFFFSFYLYKSILRKAEE